MFVAVWASNIDLYKALVFKLSSQALNDSLFESKQFCLTLLKQGTIVFDIPILSFYLTTVDLWEPHAPTFKKYYEGIFC